MAFPEYKALVFPHTTGGGPGVAETVELTITANDGTAITTPVAAVDNFAGYYDADAAGKAAHERFSAIVESFSRAYGFAIEVASDGDDVITLKYENPALHSDSSLGKPGWDEGSERPNAYELAQVFVGDNDVDVTAIAVTVNGVAQTS